MSKNLHFRDLKSFLDDTPGFFPKALSPLSELCSDKGDGACASAEAPKATPETLPLIASTHNDGLRLCMLFNNPLFSDMTLISSNGRSLHAHRLVLSSIPYFEGLFHSGMKEESTITFPDIDSASLEMILKILYGVTDVIYDFSDYLTLYIHTDRLSSEFLRDYAYRNIRYFLDYDTTERSSVFRDLIEQQELLFDIGLGYRLMKDYYNDGFRETLLSLSDTKFNDVMLKLTPYIARNGIYPCPEGIDRSNDYQDFLLLLNYWLYREFTTHEICCNSVRRKLPIYRKLISAYLTVQTVSQFVMILEQTDERFLPSEELYKHGPYNVLDHHMTFSMTPGLGYPVHWNLAIKIKESPHTMYI